jgi:hypothetical protein
MIGGRTVCLAISGDRGRAALSDNLFRIYGGYSYLDEVRLYYRKNPAMAFNAAARDSSCDILICIAGDVYVGEQELFRFSRTKAEIAFADHPMRVLGHFYPPPWSEDDTTPFIDGLFRCARQLLVDYPMQESPSFSEDVLWDRVVRPLGLRIAGVSIPAAHIDYHSPWLPRFRVWQWAVMVPTRFHPMMRWWTAPLSVALAFMWDFHVSKSKAVQAREKTRYTETEYWENVTPEWEAKLPAEG